MKIKRYKEIRGYINNSIPFYPLGLPQYNDEWQCVGYKSDEKMYLAIWRMDSGLDKIIVPINVDKANIVFGLSNVGTVGISESGLSVEINEKFNAVIIEAEFGGGNR